MVRSMKRAFLLLLAAFVAAPAAAQGIDTFEVDALDASREFGVGQTTTIPVNVTVGCGFLLEHGTSLDVTLETDLPASWGASGSDVSFSASPTCVTSSGELTEAGSIDVTPTAEAPGLERRTFTIYANTTDGDSATFDHSSDVWVEYVPGHDLDVDIDFPYTYTAEDEGAVEFNATLTISANADTMVMFENVRTSGTLSGFSGQQIFMLSDGAERTRTMSVTWTPPSGSWGNATISFYTYSHCMADEDACDMANPGARNFEENVTWEIQNEAGSGNGGDGKDSPGAGLFLIPGLAAAAFLARRRG